MTGGEYMPLNLMVWVIFALKLKKNSESITAVLFLRLKILVVYSTLNNKIRKFRSQKQIIQVGRHYGEATAHTLTSMNTFA